MRRPASRYVARPLGALLVAAALYGCVAPLTGATTAAPASMPVPAPATPTASATGTTSALPAASAPDVVATYALSTLPAIGRLPVSLAVAGEGQARRLYVAAWETANLLILATGTDGDSAMGGTDAVIGQIALNRPPRAVASLSGGRLAVLDDAGETLQWVVEGRALLSQTLPEPCDFVSTIGDELWLGMAAGGAMLRLGAGGTILGRVALSGVDTVTALAVAPDERTAYVAGDGQLAVINVATGQETAAVPLPVYRALAVSPDGARLYAGLYNVATNAAALAELDPADLAEIRRVPLPVDPIGLWTEPHSGRIAAVSATDGTLTVFDPGDLRVLWQTAIATAPTAAALDEVTGLLYVAGEANSVVPADLRTLRLGASVPLAVEFGGLAVDAAGGRWYATLSSAGQIIVGGSDGPLTSWAVGPEPGDVLPLSGGRLALLDTAGRRLRVLDAATGAGLATYATGPDPHGLAEDVATSALYAGDIVVSADGTVATVGLPTPFGGTTPSRRWVWDTRRHALYAVGSNGMPGANQGNVAVRWNGTEFDAEAPAPQAAGIVDLLYDETLDRFYAPYRHGASAGLLASAADDMAPLADLPLDGVPVAAAVDAWAGRLWLLLAPAPGSAANSGGRLVAWDTATLAPVHTLALPGDPQRLAVDTRRHRVYVGLGGEGVVWVIQDGPTSEW